MENIRGKEKESFCYDTSVAVIIIFIFSLNIFGTKSATIISYLDFVILLKSVFDRYTSFRGMSRFLLGQTFSDKQSE